ncbi:MAG: hypothetical protein QXJ02_07555, partial [Candidatus Bathyarchaeia archaeon]
MEFVFPILVLLASLVSLALASFFTIKYVEDLMERTRLSEVATGFVILAIMTCMPELTVAIFAVSQGHAGISIGDILGSHVFNIGIVIGILAIFGSMKNCGTNTLVELVDLLFLASLIPLLLIVLRIASPFVGVALICVFVFSLYRMSKKRSPTSEDVEGKMCEQKNQRNITTLAVVVLAAVVVVVAARFVVSSASEIVEVLGLSNEIIGAKIVAIGTSMPEFAFGLIAMKRNRVRLALGDTVGANLTTITLVLGLGLVFS